MNLQMTYIDVEPLLMQTISLFETTRDCEPFLVC